MREIKEPSPRSFSNESSKISTRPLGSIIHIEPNLSFSPASVFLIQIVSLLKRSEEKLEVMMNGFIFRFLVLVSLVAGFSFSANTANASDDDEIKFIGIIESLPNTAGFIGDWRVSGRVVHVSAATRIEQEDGPVVVGARVEVEGRPRSDNSVDAEEIETEDNDDQGRFEFKGTIEVLPGTPGFIGDWRIGGRTVHVFSFTRLKTEDGPVAVGAFVEVEGTPRADGSIDASEIDVKSNVAGGDGRDELKGTVESLPATAGLTGDWRVSGRTVHVTAATFINQEHGPAIVGAFVEVKGNRRVDGSIDATRIEVKTAGNANNQGRSEKLKGTVQTLPLSAGLIGDWIVSGRVVHVTSSTRLNNQHGNFAVGTRVKVKGLSLADGSIVATKIQVRDSN